MCLAVNSNMKEEEKYKPLKLKHGSLKNYIKIRIFNIQMVPNLVQLVSFENKTTWSLKKTS